MKIAATLLALAFYAIAYPSDWKVGLEASYARITGWRIYENNIHYARELSKDFVVPSLYVNKSVGERSILKVKYTHYDKIQAEGFTLATPPGSDSDIILPAFTTSSIEDDIREATLSYLVTILSTKKSSISLGPNLSYFHSKSNLTRQNNESLTYSEDDLAFGIEASASYKITSRLDASFSYRLANPPDRDVHMVSLGIGMKI